LGPNHRIVDHDWYQAYGRSWNFCEPFPSGIKESVRILGNEEGADKAEEQMAWIDHDYIDKIWDVPQFSQVIIKHNIIAPPSSGIATYNLMYVIYYNT
jgi:hypothetical protein